MFSIREAETDSADFVQLYSKLAYALGAAGVVGQNPAALISLQLPGVVVDPGMDPDNLETQYLVSNLLNVTLECNYVVTTKAGLVSDVYKLILDGKETPRLELTPEQALELKDAQAALYDRASGQPTQMFLDYQACAQRYYTALDTFNSQTTTHVNGGPKVPEETVIALKQAEHAWDDKGYRETVERDLATIAELESRNPYVYWQALQARFANGTRTLANNSTFQEVSSLPPYKKWFDQELWSPFSFDANDYKKQHRSGGTGMQAGKCRCCIPSDLQGSASSTRSPFARHTHHDQFQLLGAWDPGSGQELRLPHAVCADDFELKLSFKRINIIRPWMDSNVFYSRTWRWSAQSVGFGIDISTGGSIAGNRVASGVMPVLPTTALLAKDIEVRTSCERTRAWLQDQSSRGRMIRFGPFQLHMLPTPQASNQQVNGKAVKALLAGAPQIFGYISTLFPQCPNPDGTLPWP
ncbi:hypothetical protein GQL56_12110 [Pseudomonas putida]|nr:hypothetical protein [Pseudomonas putida]